MQTQKTQPGRVLIVDDDPAFSALLSRWLGDLDGLELKFAFNRHDAMELLEDEQWDLLISDIEMPGASGLDLVRDAKQLKPETSTLLMTAHRSMDYAIDAVRCRADDFLVKPFDKMTLFEKVSSLVARSRAVPAKARRSILAIGAHPDDVEIGAGGYLLRQRDEGAEIAILTLTGGEKGGPEDSRAKESEAAAEMLGAELVWGGLVDTAVSEGGGTIRVIEQAIARFTPDTVLIHSKNDQHQDHRNAHLATLVAARSVPNVICYQSPSSTLDFRPSLFVDVRSQMDRKIELINHYATQVSTRSYLDAELLRTTARYWGRFAGYRDVEPFEVVRGTN